MLICIIGKSGSGKDTIARLLQNWYGLKPVCSYTSRPRRDTETEGVEHYFVTKPEAQALLDEKADQVVAQTEIAGNLYFALKEDLEKADIYVIDPKGIEYLQEHFPDIPIFQLYVYCADEVALERVKSRGDILSAYTERHNSENDMFEEYYYAKKYDAIIDNTVSREAMESRLRELMKTILR